MQYGYAGAEGADVAEIVDRAQAEIYDVTEGRTSEDFVALEDLLQPTMDEIDAIASQGGIARGVPTGFVELDEVTNGLHPGQMIVIAARPGVGKALKLDTPLPTPTGWTTMGEVAVGDRLIGADGKPTRVVAATEVMLGRPCYRGRVLGRNGDRRRRRASVAHGYAGIAKVSAGCCRRIQPVQESAHVRRCSHHPRDRRDASVPNRRPPTQPFGRQRRATAGAGARPARPALHPGCVAGRRHDRVRPDHFGGSGSHHAHRGRRLRRASIDGGEVPLSTAAARGRPSRRA